MNTRFAFVVALILMCVGLMWADDAAAKSVLRPPKGSKVAIIVFEDMQCPTCGQSEAQLKQAEESEQVALVRHDFPLPQHNWSFDAHVLARYFDTQSATLGEDFRHWIYTNQRMITKANLHTMVQQFASSHQTTLPLFVDPSGQLAAKVKADAAVGQSVGINQTPTIYVAGDLKSDPTYVRVDDRNNLVAAVQQMKSRVEAETPKAPAAKHATKRAKSAK